MTAITPENLFIIPPPVSEKDSVVHSSCYRLALSIVRRSATEPVLVAIDNLHYSALLFDDHILFADNSRQLQVNQRNATPVTMEWQFFIAEKRDNNEQHIPMKIRFHSTGLDTVQQQLTVSFYEAMMQIDQLYADNVIPSQPVEVMMQPVPQDNH